MCYYIINPMNQLSKTDIYKVHVLGTSNIPDTIIVFCKSTLPDPTLIDAGDIAKGTRILYSGEQLYIDDNIHSLKKKIIGELGINNVAYPELYLFCKIPTKVDYAELSKEIGENSTEHVRQLFHNYGIESATYDEKTMEAAFHGNEVIRTTPLGTF